TVVEVPGSAPPPRGWKIAAGAVDDEGEKKRKHMAARTKKSRRTTGHDAVATIRLSSELRESVDAWAAKQSDKPARPEAILRLVELGLESSHGRESAPNRGAKASEMAAREVGGKWTIAPRGMLRPFPNSFTAEASTTCSAGLFTNAVKAVNSAVLAPPERHDASKTPDRH